MTSQHLTLKRKLADPSRKLTAHVCTTPSATVPQADALFAKGYRVIAGFDILWIKAMAAETQSWTRDQK